MCTNILDLIKQKKIQKNKEFKVPLKKMSGLYVINRMLNRLGQIIKPQPQSSDLFFY
jgi:hypothetical protein